MAGRILIVSHRKPDGDAIGASLALKLGLQGMNKSAEVAFLDLPTDNFAFLPQFFNIRDEFAPQDFDTVVLLDCGDWTRTGFFTDSELNIDWPKHLIVVDHHKIQQLTPGLHIIDATASSTAELIFYILQNWEVEITRDIATCLLVGLSTDTGSFKHTNTTKAVLQVAGILLEKGANLGKIARYVYADKTISKLKLWGRVLTKLKRNRKWNLLVSVVTQIDLDDCGATIEDLEGVIDLLRTVPGVKAVVLGSERKDEFKFSLRTEDLRADVSKLAALMGGGGHVKAASFAVPKENIVIPD
ncbi:MAG: bifunctional oligoribonuclease/PAP phosphatase NrnA [Patescibacteria group bacterium]